MKSKFLSFVLRHAPETIGLKLDAAGWADVTDLLACLAKHGKALRLEELQEVVRTNNKKRFAFNADQTKIRASQGHSIKIDPGYEPLVPPEVLYHGTAQHNRDSIFQKGIEKRQRHHVHLSSDTQTARAVGARHGRPIVLQIAAQRMYEDGLVFYKSENGVWLTEYVPTVYILNESDGF